jgi:hypothetical protein
LELATIRHYIQLLVVLEGKNTKEDFKKLDNFLIRKFPSVDWHILKEITSKPVYSFDHFYWDKNSKDSPFNLDSSAAPYEGPFPPLVLDS